MKTFGLIAFGIIIGWLTVGILFATPKLLGWTSYEKNEVLQLLRLIESHTCNMSDSMNILISDKK